MKVQKKNSLKLYGRWRLEARHIKTGELIVKDGKNLICTVGKGLVGDLLIDTAGFDTGLTYQAIGISNTAPTIDDTKLNSKVHKADDEVNVVTAADADDLTTLEALLNEIKGDYNAHRVSTTFHDAADTTNVVDAANASDLATSIALANQIKAMFNAHRAQDGVHPLDDTFNEITSDDATDLDTCITLANEIKNDYNAHLAQFTEASRKAATSRSRSVNEITITTFFTAGESTYAIEEAGIFGHSTASVTPDSGIIFSHWLVSFDNSGGVYDITISYILTIG